MWKCFKCDTEFDKLQIEWGTSSGVKVDIIDYFCPHCGNTGYPGEPKILFMGSKEDENTYWEKEWAA